MPEYVPIIPTAEPFLFPGDKIGALLVHGLTGAPKEMRTMGEYLAGQGHTVLGIRLPGHATQLEDIRRMRWQDWLHAVEDGYHCLRSAGCRVFIMGLSMGGLLTLNAAARLPIAGAVGLSVPYFLPDPRLPYARYLAWIIPTAPKGPGDWQDTAMAREHVDYPVYPTRSIAQLHELILETRRSLAQIRCPVLLAHSRNDSNISSENMERIYAELGSTDKSMLWLEKSGHILPRDLERERLFEAVEQFVRRVCKATSEAAA